MAHILCFGDSITQGYTDLDGGWTQRLNVYLTNIYIDDQKNPRHGVFNLGIDADTTTGLLKRFPAEVKPRLSKHEENIIIIAIGTNDTVYSTQTNFVQSTVEKYHDELSKLVGLAKKATQNVVLVGLWPCEEDKMQPMPWSKSGKCYSNQRLKSFNDEMRKVAVERDVEFIDMFADMKTKELKFYLHDGLHPNSVGHQYIADKLKKKVAAMAANY